jgi:hypothetical protein
MTPTARTLTFLRQSGFQAAVVEKWLPHVNLRSDLWHFGDVIAAHPIRRQILLVQVTTLNHVAHRLEKAKRQPELAGWLRAGGGFQVHGWYCRGSKWTCKIVEVHPEALAAVVLQSPGRRGRKPVQPDLFAGDLAGTVVNLPCHDAAEAG